MTEFEKRFNGQLYRHRNATLGDFVAMHLYEDLVKRHKSIKLHSRVGVKPCVLHSAKKRQGMTARRGAGTLGEMVPGEVTLTDPGDMVSRGRVATMEIGVEGKMLAEAMMKQIDRVSNDLKNPVSYFHRG